MWQDQLLVQRFLLFGHTKPMKTQRYALIVDEPLRAAAEVMASMMNQR